MRDNLNSPGTPERQFGQSMDTREIILSVHGQFVGQFGKSMDKFVNLWDKQFRQSDKLLRKLLQTLAQKRERIWSI